MPTDASTPLSAHFNLGSLTVTNQLLSMPNMPSTQDEMNNLSMLADMLEQITAYVGPFTILSGYRTRELQERLAAIGEPVAERKSFHEVGRGADITPTTMGLVEFFGRIVANEGLRNRLSEISIKPSQNSIHLAVNVPGDERTPKILTLDASTGEYARLEDAQIADFIKPYLPPTVDVLEVASDMNASGPNKTVLMIAGGLALLMFMISGKKKSTEAEG